MGSDQARGQQVVRIALELQAQDESRQAVEDFAHEVRDAAVAEGLDVSYLQKAEAELQRREAAAIEAAQRRRKKVRSFLRVGVALALTVVFGWQFKQHLLPAPPAPWADAMEDATRWSLDVDPGSHAQVKWEQEAGRGQVAVVAVEAFANDKNVQPRVNFDGLGVPSDLSGYSDVLIDVKGTLPNARVYFEAGPEERWRSPAIGLTGSWAEHRIPLKAFEHQVRESGKWKTTRWATPKGITQSSVKVGWFINPPEAVGDVHVDRLRLE